MKARAWEHLKFLRLQVGLPGRIYFEVKTRRIRKNVCCLKTISKLSLVNYSTVSTRKYIHLIYLIFGSSYFGDIELDEHEENYFRVIYENLFCNAIISYVYKDELTWLNLGTRFITRPLECFLLTRPRWSLQCAYCFGWTDSYELALIHQLPDYVTCYGILDLAGLFHWSIHREE